MGCSATPVRGIRCAVRRSEQYLDGVTTEFAEEHRGGDFSPIEPTTRGGPDYGRFVEAVRTLQDRVRAVDAPDEVITEAASLLEAVSNLLLPYETDEWSSPSGRRMDLPNRGSVLGIPAMYKKTDDDRIRGVAQFRRFHLGRNGAVHGGCIAQLFDSLLGFTAFRLTRSLYQRTAFLHVDKERSCRSKPNCRSTPVSTASTDARCSSQDSCSTGRPCWPRPTRCS